ncbi:Oxidoreductase N-terminal [Penicillium sp. DV-2018c]|nr:Oxidoreductase N-terminal [Penicillium sp. DV-2018c]
MPPQVLRLGILGATNAVQATYLPVLQSLKTHYTLTAIYDPNEQIANQCQIRFDIKHSTAIAEEVLLHKEVDVVLNLLPMEYHEQYTVTALEAGKDVMVEVPLTMSIRSFRRIREAINKGQTARSSHINNTNSELTPDKPKIFVGCARRYAPCFTEVFKKEIASLGRIYYARCRHIAGPMNSVVSPSAEDITSSNREHNDPEQFREMIEDVFGCDEDDLMPDRVAFCRYLGMLGCHDLSVMRESLGLPDAVSNVAITNPFYSAIFHYTNPELSGGHPFTLTYEAGIDAVPRCDAHLTVYGAHKTVSVMYDFPRPGEKISTGTFVRVVVEEADETVKIDDVNEHEINEVENAVPRPRVKRTEMVSTCDEAYEREFLALHSYLVSARSAAKTTAEDAVMDLRMLLMIFDHYNRQCGTIRTPLG